MPPKLGKAIEALIESVTVGVFNAFPNEQQVRAIVYVIIDRDESFDVEYHCTEHDLSFDSPRDAMAHRIESDEHDAVGLVAEDE